jgi:hypothetical protein
MSVRGVAGSGERGAIRVTPVGVAVPTAVCAYGRLRQRQRQRRVPRRFSESRQRGAGSGEGKRYIDR